MERLHVFVDEFGDPHLDAGKPGVSTTYIVTALCVRDRSLGTVVDQVEKVRRRHFQTGEMKSSAVATNDGRRLQIMRELTRLDAFVIAFCARKKQLRRDTGFEFKKSFIKFFAGALIERVTRCAGDVHVTMDAHGSLQFRGELKSYLDRRFRNDLFSNSKFQADDSKGNLLLQAADFFAGTLARVYDDEKVSDRSEEFKSILRDRVSVTLWPRGIEEGHLPVAEYASEDDESIRRYCVQSARAYLTAAERQSEDRDELARAIFLDALLANHSLG